MGDLYIGLMSGTSMDGIDAALVDFGDATLNLLQTHNQPYPAELKERLLSAIRTPLADDIDDIGNLNHELGVCFRDAALTLLHKADTQASAVTAIGSHGQTVRHQPHANPPFTLQIGDPALIAAGTGITTVADFRTADIEAGGQGAPLAPLFHEWLFGSQGTQRVVLNIGGIANVTLLSANDATTGFDTGPGNTLMDAWIRKHRDESFDRSGAWASSGNADAGLLSRFLGDSYFAAAPPKSTGFEYFNTAWIEAADTESIDPTDVQATLCTLTAVSIADAIAAYAPTTTELLVCGGGVHNNALMLQISNLLPAIEVASTASMGLDPDWVEAVAFAWLAMRRLHDLPGNLPSVTGAASAVPLGIIHRTG